MQTQTNKCHTSSISSGLTVFTLQKTSRLLRKHDYQLALIIQNILIEYAEDISGTLSNRHNVVPLSLDQLRMQLIINSLSTLKTQKPTSHTINIEQLVYQWTCHYTHKYA